MILLTPFLMLLVFGGMFLAQGTDMPEMARPFIGVAAMGMILLTMTQLIGNQFGFDRNGFRVFVLCAAPRRDILLGKNMAVAPLALGLGTALVLVVQVVYPMRVDRLLSVLITCVSMYLLYCLLANLLSILAPMPVAATSMKPVNPKALQFLLHVAFAMCLPFVLGPVVLPLGVDLLLQALEVLEGIPVGLALALLALAAVVLIYRAVLGWQGTLLQGARAEDPRDRHDQGGMTVFKRRPIPRRVGSVSDGSTPPRRAGSVSDRSTPVAYAPGSPWC